MSLSRLVKFPLLKLPYLCIESVIRSSDIFDIIFFALLSRKTRRIVKSLSISLNGIRVSLTSDKCIKLGRDHKPWNFIDGKTRGTPLVLQKNAAPLYTDKSDLSMDSYTAGNEAHALKMTLEFLNDVFRCTVDEVDIEGNNIPESGDVGVRSTVNLCLIYEGVQDFGPVRNQHLNLLLEKLEVTGTFDFYIQNSGYCDPKLFKCQELLFWSNSSKWVTLEILLQFEVPRLKFYEYPLEDIVAFITNWFHSDNKKLEYLFIQSQHEQISLEELQDLNSIEFSERTQVPESGLFPVTDLSKGLEIVRHDGLRATIHGGEEGFMNFLFYIWHNQ
ncbi:unnamed protein product [Caenorhabditis brenneri]